MGETSRSVGSRSAAGYTDVFPVDEFAKTMVGVERAHLVRGPRGGRHSARCRLSVNVWDAEMDYGAFGDYNKRHGMERGVMRFRFADAKRTRVQSLWWNEVRVLTADGRTRMMRVVGAARRSCSRW